MIDRAADAESYEVVCGGFDPYLFSTAEIGTSDRTLDVGCGYGATTRAAARRAPEGYAVGNDIAPPLLEQARAFATAEGLGNVVFESGDAEVHAFPPGGFDLAISRFGVMFFADPVAGFANIRRALRPGGRLVFVTVGPPEGNDLPRVIAAAMPAPATAPIRSLADPAYVEEVLTGAGYENVAVEPAETTIEPGPDAAATAAFILAWGAFRGAVDENDPDAVAAVREALTEAARPYETSSGVRLRSTAWLVSALA